MVCDYFLPNAADLGKYCTAQYDLSIVSCLRGLFAGGIDIISGKRRGAPDQTGDGFHGGTRLIIHL
jgi:hypothetical protein